MITAMEQGPSRDQELDPSVWEESSLEVVEPSNSPTPPPLPTKKRKPPRRKLITKRNLVGFALIMLMLGMVVGGSLIALRKSSSKPSTTYIINTQSLDNGTLNKLTSQADGNVKQQLTITPDTIFKNNVTVQGSEQISKDLTVAGRTTLQGPASFSDSLTVGRSLTVTGNTALAGSLSVTGQITAASLNVGSLTLSSINLSNNLVFAGHLIPNGATPAVRPSVAASGGTVTISGNDTAGTITINVGNGLITPGEMAIITFKTAFNTTPKVQLTPINAAASGLRYYATRSAGLFTVDTSTAPSAGGTYVFDYLVTQ